MKKHFKRIAIFNWSSLSFIHITVLFLYLNTSFVQASFLIEDHGVTASDAAEGVRFGSGIAISRDTAVIRAPDNNDFGANMGSAYLLDLDCNAENHDLPPKPMASNQLTQHSRYRQLRDLNSSIEPLQYIGTC